jgi:hypothetical protein
MVFRYKTCAFGIRAVWTRDQHGQPAATFLMDDGQEHGVCRLTVEHGAPITPPPSNDFAGSAFWVRVGSHLESEEQFLTWQQQFIAAKVNRCDIEQNDVAIEVAGQDGIVSVNRQTTPAPPLGILSLNGQDLGRPILEKISYVARFVTQRNEAKPIIVKPSGTYWEAESGYSFFEDWIEPDDSASGKFAARINHDVAWQLQVEQTGEYVLWGRVQTLDSEHDSFRMEAAQRLPDGTFTCQPPAAAWPLGVRANWTWVRLPLPLHLEPGVWQLTLKPREYDGRIDQLFLTIEPAVKP